MKLANNNKVVLKHREIFRECFESMLKWFHNTYIDGDVTKLMPLTIGGYEICLFDLYKLVKCFGGYERLNYKMKWDEVSLGFGFSGLYGLRFKEIYVHYLLIPETYFEVAKVGLTSTDDYIRENCLVTRNNEVSMMSEHVNKVDIQGTSRDWEQITSIKQEREGWNFIS
ncbi:ARID DNA-binding domain-containing protein [Tanacetum coccineum]